MNRRSVLSILGLGGLAGCGGGGGGSGGGRGGGSGGRTDDGAGGELEISFPDFLQVGTAPAYWIQDGVWNARGLTRGTYSGLGGAQYETAISRSTALGPNGEIAWRSGWKFPNGVTEEKAYLSAIFGSKPGYSDPWVTPGGHKILLPDNTYSTVRPSGATPGSFLPMTPPAGVPGAWPDLFASFDYKHQVAPTGRGQLAFDLWLQDSPLQAHGFNVSPITHEIMIPLDYWGNYGAQGHRNPDWYSHDVVIDGRLWHAYLKRNFVVRDFPGGWTFVVFQPDAPLSAGTLNLGAFLRHLSTRTDTAGQPWAKGTEHLVSVELGVEVTEGVGDLAVSNYRVWTT